MTHELPSLPYRYGDLEPHIDEATMRLHHTKHHQGYVDKLNAALENYPDLAGKSLDALLADLSGVPEAIRTAVRNHGGGHWNHSFFWSILAPASSGFGPKEETITALDGSFGGFEPFKRKFKETALNLFGSGWIWLIVEGRKLEFFSTANQDSPRYFGKKPILGLDLWEHAYYLKYQNRRGDYVDSSFGVVNWPKVEELLSS